MYLCTPLMYLYYLGPKKIPIISYASPSKLLSDKSKYKYFFRVIPSNEKESEVLKQLLRKYSFREVMSLSSLNIYGM